jgi:glutaminyl-tRNA synthetase
VNPEDPAAGTRNVAFTRTIFVERDDFREVPPPKYHRLFPGNEVRLRGAYLVRCTDVIKDASGHVVELRCTYDPASRGGSSPDGRKVKSTIHWTSAARSVPATVRLYDALFARENPDDDSDGRDWREHLNPASLVTISDARVEGSTAALPPGTTVQFERLGYFCVDADSTPERPVFNRSITLKDSWAKIEKTHGAG